MLDQMYKKLETVAQHDVSDMLQPYLPEHATIEVILKGERQCSILIGEDLTDNNPSWACINLACDGEIITSVQLRHGGEGLTQNLKVSTHLPLVTVTTCLIETFEQLEQGNINKAAHIIEHAKDYFSINELLRRALR